MTDGSAKKTVTAKELADLATGVETAAERYREAKQRSAEAHREETNRLNTLNDAEKAFDAATQAFRDGQSFDTRSDWNTRT